MAKLSPPGGPGRGRRPKRPSPILIPGRREPSVLRRLGNWLRRLFGSSRVKQVRETPLPPPPPTPPDPSPIEESEPEFTDAVAEAPPRATIQMLPGRLEPLIPEVIQQEVRFQRAPGEEQEVTLGWELGDPPHHVTLDHPSIQPLHAKMTYQKGRWMIESQAPNDPVEINGTAVPPSAGPYLLAAGDQVRIGEALFRFFMP